MNLEYPTTMKDWASKLGITQQAEPWSVSFTITTAPVENWFYSRKALKPDDTQLRLTVPSYGLWCIDLQRHDELFHSQWRPGGDFRVDSQQMKYRKIIKWPGLDSPIDFPLFAGLVERSLSIQFIRHMNVGSNGIDTDKWVSAHGHLIQ